MKLERLANFRVANLRFVPCSTTRCAAFKFAAETLNPNAALFVLRTR
jgi:hypothetical protein